MLVPIYNKTTGGAFIRHSRMRMRLSSRNAHRFKYNFISNSRCLLCQHRSEDTTHFLLHCPALATPRVTLLAKVREALAPLQNHPALRIIHQYPYEFHNLLLLGSIHLDKSVNVCVL